MGERFSGSTEYHTCPLSDVDERETRTQDTLGHSGYIPIVRNLDALHPVAAAAVRPTLKFDLAVVDDGLLVEREDDGARNGHVLD